MTQALARPVEHMRNALSLLGKGNRTAQEMRTLIMGLEAAMFAMTEHHIEFPITNHFAPGIYMREMFIPKGATLTGKIHKTEHMNILSQGDLTVWTEHGMKRLKASTVIKSMPGIKRVGHAHEDSVWITVHLNPDDERDPDKLVDRLTARSFEEFDYLASNRTYQDAIGAHGFTHDQAWEISQREDDQIPFPDPVTGLVVSDSPIHGKGLFATKRFEKGEIMAPVRIDGKRTPAGRYCNHSADPNSEMIMRENGNVDLLAIRAIDPGSEILNDYFFNFANTRPGAGLINGGNNS